MPSNHTLIWCSKKSIALNKSGILLYPETSFPNDTIGCAHMTGCCTPPPPHCPILAIELSIAPHSILHFVIMNLLLFFSAKAHEQKQKKQITHAFYLTSRKFEAEPDTLVTRDLMLSVSWPMRWVHRALDPVAAEKMKVILFSALKDMTSDKGRKDHTFASSLLPALSKKSLALQNCIGLFILRSDSLKPE